MLVHTERSRPWSTEKDVVFFPEVWRTSPRNIYVTDKEIHFEKKEYQEDCVKELTP